MYNRFKSSRCTVAILQAQNKNLSYLAIDRLDLVSCGSTHATEFQQTIIVN